ncbi:MAG: ATP-grasp domain-containing protein [Planctomycetes bacterium]|nr:ATP-grasp domain-containing protein [Planctomycetota bacterium]
MLSALIADFQRVPGAAAEKVSAPFHEEKGPDTFFLVIAPEFDDLLRSRSQAVLDAGGRLLGSLPDAIRLTGDKLATARYWQERGVPHPATAQTFADIPPPWVLKPRFGAGSQATFLIRDNSHREECLQAARREWPAGELVVQSYVAGFAASVALLIGPEQTTPLQPARQHLSSDGRFRYSGGSLPIPSPLADRAVRRALDAVAGIRGLQGYVGVDLVLGDDADYAIEINPRLTTSYLGLRQLCRQNLAELILRCVQGEVLSPPTWHPGEVRFSA